MKDEEKTKEQLMKELVELRQQIVVASSREGERDAEINIESGILEILDALPFYTLLVDETHHILLANKAVRRDLGLDPEQIVGGYCPKVVHGLDGPFPGCPLEEAVEKGHAVERELFDPDSGWWMKAAVYPTELRTQEGRAIFFHMVHDITERKRAEEELQYTLEKLREALGGIIQTVALTVETRDPYTAGHQRRVSDLARAIATEMGLSAEQIDGVRMAGAIHDLGKISIPAEILSKPGQLDNLQYGLIQTHSQVGYDILKTIEFPWPVAQIVLQHHERLDGSGYPRGLPGEDIMLEARILAVADVVEAMASFRPYRPALGIDKALEEISHNRGVLYDSEVVDACLKLFTAKRFKFE